MEEVQFDTTGQKNLDWDSYPVIRFNQVRTSKSSYQPAENAAPSAEANLRLSRSRPRLATRSRCNWRALRRDRLRPERVLAL